MAYQGSEELIDHLTVTLDDSGFAAPIRPALFDREGKANLAWDLK